MIENTDCGNDENKKRLATTITSLMISFRDEFEMQNWKKNKECIKHFQIWSALQIFPTNIIMKQGITISDLFVTDI